MKEIEAVALGGIFHDEVTLDYVQEGMVRLEVGDSQDCCVYYLNKDEQRKFYDFFRKVFSDDYNTEIPHP